MDTQQSKPQQKPLVKVKVMFVCMGNICRSPSAEAVFRYHVESSNLAHSVEVASSGTHNYHVGDSADPRSYKAALKRGVNISAHRAQHLKTEHFRDYDYILVMDDANYSHVTNLCPPQYLEKVHYFMDFAPQIGVREVPDPYLGGEEGFEHVLDLIEAATAGLMSEIRDRHIDPPRLHPEINA